MKTKYSYSIKKISTYCRWNVNYAPDNWCIVGIYKRWPTSETIIYHLCLLGFEIRINVNRKFKPWGYQRSFR